MPNEYDYLSAPQRGSETLRATPTPRDLFRGYVRGGYNLFDAVAEYVDNSIDQGTRVGRSRSGAIDVTVGYDGKEFLITIHDTAGGCRRADAANFLQPGRTSVSAQDHGISRFGIGGKVAGISVARRIVVFSKFPSDRGFGTVLDRDSLLKQDTWDFRLFDLPIPSPVKDGETEIVLYGVGKEAHNGYPESYLAKFGERYALLLGSTASPVIRVGGASAAPVDPYTDMLSATESPPGCGPQTYEFVTSLQMFDSRDLPVLEKVTAKITVGLMPERSTTGRAGARIYCNRRQVVSCTELGLVEGSHQGAVRRAHPESDQVWLRAVVEMDGPAELMPWTNRKDALDASAPSYGFLYTNLVDSYRRFIQENVVPLKLQLKRDHGLKDADIFDVLKFSYAKRASLGQLKADALRPRVRTSRAFQASREVQLDAPAPAREPREAGEKTISGQVEPDKLARVKAQIRRAKGDPEEPSNVELIRIMMDHYLSCPEIRRTGSSLK